MGELSQRIAEIPPGLRTIQELLRDQAGHDSDAVALMAPGRAPLTYGRLNAQMQDVARTLRAMGLGRQDRVALVLPNGSEMAVACLTVAADAICAPLNPDYRAQEYDAFLADLGAAALIVQAGMASPARAVAQARGVPIIDLSPVAGAEVGIFTLIGDTNREARRDGFAEPEDVAFLLPTSGTTGRSKLVPLTQHAICTSARNIAAALALSPADRCLNVMPLFHVHGLIAALLSSLAAGASVMCTPGFVAPKFFAWLEELRPTWYTAVPTIHQAILARASLDPTAQESVAHTPLRFIRSSSAPLPTSVMAELERVFNAPVVESYGMTEAAQQVTSNPLPPGVRKPGSVGLPSGPEVAVADAAGHRMAPGERGEIIIRGATVMRGYQDDPVANAAAFTQGWFRTGDQGLFDADGYLFITGRIKELINRGGEKISPREVEEVLLEHPAVVEAVSFAVPDARLGEDVGAAVVLREGTTAIERELREHVAEQLADFKVPRHVVIVPGIPKGPTGKVQRTELAKQLGMDAPGQAKIGRRAEWVAPRTLTEERLAGIWAEVLQIGRVGVRDDFFDLGGESLLATQVISRVRDTMGVDLSFLTFFDAPTLEGMAGSVEEARSAGAVAAPIRPPSGGPLPPSTSYAQDGLWFLDQLEPGSAAYNVPVALRLHGPLEIEALEQSLSDIVRRHEVLRTSFAAVDGHPIPVVAPARSLPLHAVDLTQLPPTEREAEALRLATQEAQRPFDLARGPLLRTTLLRLDEQEHVLLLTMHHIVVDEWSRIVLYRELSTLYAGYAGGKRRPLPDLPIQYTDFAGWQRAHLQGEALETHLAYWRQRLGGAPPVLDLPTARPRPAVLGSSGERMAFTLPPRLDEPLRAIGREQGATLYMTLLAAFQTLLARYSGQEDIVIGSPIAGRTRRELEGLIGYFVNMLPLRADLSGDPTFREALGRVRDVCLEAYAHQDLPFEQLVEALQPERDPSRTPLFQAVFQLERAAEEALDLAGVTIRPLAVDTGTARFDLTLALTESEQGLRGELHYRRELFEEGWIQRLLEHFQMLLEGIVADPDRRLSELPLLSAAERHQLLVGWNDTAVDFPGERCLHELFEAQAARTPDAVAVVFEGQELSYGELNGRANQVAHYLQNLGVGPEVLVGLYLERSLGLVVGLLGIMKAGGAYVPLDASYPEARVAFMLEDTQAGVVVTQERLLGRLPAGGARVVCLDRDWALIAKERAENLKGEATAENLAYVIYTSGSTGQPKGVAVEHRNAVAFLDWATTAFDSRERAGVLASSSICFDPSILELFLPLSTGGTAILAENVLQLPDLPAAGRVTLVDTVPSAMVELLRVGGLPPSVRTVTLGGEPLPGPLVQEIYQPGMVQRILNLYGPTETTLYCTTAEVAEGTCTSPPAGRPIANTQIYILDRFLQPVPTGLPGELYIGGAGLARGYHNRPELTAQTFIPNPFSTEPGARLYRTGDQARYLPDGNIEFLGRLDDQVKIRGFRVEPGEIAATLGQHPSVREAVVVVREDEPGDKRLVAYLAPHQEPAPADSNLREFLKTKLPEYMVPSAFVTLAALPLTPNGKVDRRALPMPGAGRSERERTYLAPRTPVEEALASIWSDVLRIDRVGIDENFFDLGGHSLLATRVISRVRDGLRVDLPLRRLFEMPTIADLAGAIEALTKSGAKPSRPELARLPREAYRATRPSPVADATSANPSRDR
jgi:amino acid adenylation domain-containing protein